MPSFHILHSGITESGQPRSEGYLVKVLNGITPIDARTTQYCYAFSRNFGVEREAVSQDLAEGLATVLTEDKNALELQEIGLQSRPSTEHDALIAQDAGITKARRIMDRLLTAEKEGPRG